MNIEETAVEAKLKARNIGGIRETEVVFEPGVTVLTGRNATNRTSLLQAIMAALGSEQVSIHASADEATVEMALGDEAYTRTFTRRNGTVVADGAPYLDDPEVPDLFAFLLESNEARQAVTTGSDLRDIIMRPVDTEEIESEIDNLRKEQREVNHELEEVQSAKERLPDLEQEQSRLESEIERVRDELQAVEQRLDETSADVDRRDGADSELEAKFEELRERRSELDDVRYSLETERESLSTVQSELATLNAEAEELPDAPAEELETLEAQIDRLRERKRELESESSELQSVIQFNQEMLESDGALLDEAGDDDSVTDELLPDDSVDCWTCGSEVATETIESNLDTLRDRSAELVGEIDDVEAELDALKRERDEHQEKRRRQEEIERRRQELTDEVEETEARIEELEERRDGLREAVAALDEEIESLEEEEYEEIRSLHTEANDLENELGRLENELDRVEENIGTVESRVETESELEQRHEELETEIESLRTRIERIERQAVDTFNDHMETVLDRLGYDNLERVWLERVERTVREGRRKVDKSGFELHVVRATKSGTVYEDTVDHLSESEREVIGLVFTLAGYLAHDVHDTVPFMLLDSLEAIDAERIAALVDYFSDYSEYLVVALLPEDAAAIDVDHQRITDI